VSRRRRDRLRAEVLELYALFEQHGAERLSGAMAAAHGAGAYDAEYVRALLAEDAPADVRAPRLRLVVPDVPAQEEVDRLLSSYEVFVVGAGDVAMGGEG
jgi:hypothetical protein